MLVSVVRCTYISNFRVCMFAARHIVLTFYEESSVVSQGFKPGVVLNRSSPWFDCNILTV